jgi:membrane protein implicated in regulation of membrane protease activity
MQVWHMWLIAGLMAFVAEMVIPGFLVACLGVGCLASSLAALLGAGLSWQLIAFSIATMVSLFTIRPLMLKYAYRKSDGEATNVAAIVGKVGMVLETIERLSGKGRVKVGGEDWKAVSAGGETILKDREVRVTNIEGVTLTVAVISEEKLTRLGVVVEAVDPAHGKGLVKVSGKESSAVTADDSTIEEGRRVRVVEDQGDKLVVVEVEGQ